jgi:hypothetical protein
MSYSSPMFCSLRSNVVLYVPPELTTGDAVLRTLGVVPVAAHAER